MQPLVSLFEKVTQRLKSIESDIPLGFEIMGINSGFVMYETILTNDQKEVSSPVNLTISTIRDQATIFLDQVPIYLYGILIYFLKQLKNVIKHSLPLSNYALSYYLKVNTTLYYI